MVDAGVGTNRAPDADTFFAQLEAEFERRAQDKSQQSVSNEVYDLFQEYAIASDDDRRAEIDKRLSELQRSRIQHT